MVEGQRLDDVGDGGLLQKMFVDLADESGRDNCMMQLLIVLYV